jgi:hypothetical protein
LVVPLGVPVMTPNGWHVELDQGEASSLLRDVADCLTVLSLRDALSEAHFEALTRQSAADAWGSTHAAD